MSKTIAFAHPDKTMMLELPDELYEALTKALGVKVARYRFIDTDNAMRGEKFNTIIIEELSDER